MTARPRRNAILRPALVGLLALLVLGAGAAALFWSWHPTSPDQPQPERGREAIYAPRVRFTDITQAAGIHFRHVNGAAGAKLLPETMGSGVAFLDYDNDGRQDLLLVNSRPWPGAGAGPLPTLALYHNNGDGTFTMPADILPTAANKPVGIVYDSDGAVTNALLGSGAGDTFYCFTNAVFGGVDNLSTDAHLLHALVIMNGNCAQTAAQLPDVKYRLVRMLGRVLGLDWSEVDAEAEALEHAISPRLEQAIAAHLGEPLEDPHGHLIPTREGAIARRDLRPLHSFRAGQRAIIREARDDSPERLRRWRTLGLTPGATVHFLSPEPLADLFAERADVRPRPAVDAHPRRAASRAEDSKRGDGDAARRALDRLTGPLRFVERGAAGLYRRVHRRLSLIHISEPTRLLSISYAVFCLKK